MKKAIPSSFTMGNLFCGFFAIILSSNTNEEFIKYAVFLIILAMVLDALDGRLARILHVEGEFGKELDSLADIVTFGVAPAVIMYNLALHELGIIGVIFSGLFSLCGAFRLARFNIQSDGSKYYFIGLPITSGGGLLTVYAMYYKVIPISILLIITCIISLLMISNLKYSSFKYNKKHSTYAVIFIFIISITLSIIKFVLIPYIITTLLFIYTAFAIIETIKNKKMIDINSNNTEIIDK